MMNYHDDVAGDPWSYDDDIAGMFRGDYSNDDLFELVSRGGGGGGGGTPAVSCLGLPPQFIMQPPPPPPASSAPPEAAALQRGPPSEDEMASWLYAIVVRGGDQEHAADHGGVVQQVTSSDAAMVMDTVSSVGKTDKLKEGMATKDTENASEERRNMPGGARRSHHGPEHNQTEKRRRWKINERFKTLQQLVPGCEKSNHASTLDQTISYMKSLQHQVDQAMSSAGGHARPPAVTAAAVFPVVQPPPYMPPVVLGGPPHQMVPFPPVFPYPAVMVPAAAAPPLYPAPAARPPRAAPVARGGSRPVSSSSNKGNKGSCSSRRRRPKDRS